MGMLMVLGTVKSYQKSQALRRIESVRTGVAPFRYCTLPMGGPRFSTFDYSAPGKSRGKEHSTVAYYITIKEIKSVK